jgi:uncharacterized protein
MALSPGVHFLAPSLPIHVMQAEAPGPCAVIQGGIHGDEIAGVHALYELLEEGFRPSAGKLLIIPVLNPPAYRARQRCAPGGLDLNRCFPGNPEAPEREQRLAAQLLEMLREEQPTLIATLHESWKRLHPNVAASFGQSLVYGVKPVPPILEAVVEQLNQTLQNPYELWATHYYPVATSSTEVIVDALGCIGTCVETWMGFEEQRRIAMHKDVVRGLLRELGMLPQAEQTSPPI